MRYQKERLKILVTELITKSMADYFDKDGLLCHKRFDSPEWECGDSAREWGTYETGLRIRDKLSIGNNGLPFIAKKDFINALDKYRVSKEPLLYCRHPKSVDLWHRDPKEFSRDQQTALENAAIWTGLYFAFLNPLYHAQLKRFGKYQNKDWRIWEWILFWRLDGRKHLTLSILDFGLVINSIIICIKGVFNKKSVENDINHATNLITCIEFSPTKSSRLAFWLYKTLRPYPIAYRWGENSILSCWRVYYQKPENPPQDEVWAPILKHYFD